MTRRVRLVLMVPRGWLRILQPAELGLAGLLAKPINSDELLDGVSNLSHERLSGSSTSWDAPPPRAGHF